MAVKATLIRNPYPVPDVSREGSWVTHGPYLGKNVAPNDRRWYARLQSHERLFAHHTLASVRKDVRLFRPEVPADSLDLNLSSVYEHSKDFSVPKMYIHIQPETLGKETWRVLRNQIKIFSKLPPPLGHSLIRAGYTEAAAYKSSSSASGKAPYEDHMKIRRRINPSSLKLSIDGPHVDQTNAGYSRKVDGTFYNI